jgi:hypothetical protein
MMDNESEFYQPVTRKIVKEFATEIEQAKLKTDSLISIYFRDEDREGKTRRVWKVPFNLLRFRKDNGRISTDVEDYETNHSLLDETRHDTQKELKRFLKEKDPNKTEELKRSIRHRGQEHPAIITVDGFLINGNRRRLVLEELYDETKDSRFQYMKVVILPSEDQEGGAPNIFEIEKIENRYQLQSDGKSEYSGLDRAVSIRSKINKGYSLEEQLRDDAQFRDLSQKEFSNKIKDFEKEYLKPLEAVDRYLDFLNRKKRYRTIKGQWQSFIDYYQYIEQKIDDNNFIIEHGIRENDIGAIKAAAFHLIRYPDFSKVGIRKSHFVIRDMGRRWIRTKESRNEFLRMVDSVRDLNDNEKFDKFGNEYEDIDQDKFWATNNSTVILGTVKRAKDIIESQDEAEKPIKLLEGAYNKLIHPGMEISMIPPEEIEYAIKLAEKIEKCADEIKTKIYYLKKNK